MKQTTRNAFYSVACMEDPEDYDTVFFVTFNTKNEKEALRIASCVCGKDKAESSLVIINDSGEVFML